MADKSLKKILIFTFCAIFIVVIITIWVGLSTIISNDNDRMDEIKTEHNSSKKEIAEIIDSENGDYDTDTIAIVLLIGGPLLIFLLAALNTFRKRKKNANYVDEEPKEEYEDDVNAIATIIDAYKPNIPNHLPINNIYALVLEVEYPPSNLYKTKTIVSVGDNDEFNPNSKGSSVYVLLKPSYPEEITLLSVEQDNEKRPFTSIKKSYTRNEFAKVIQTKKSHSFNASSKTTSRSFSHKTEEKNKEKIHELDELTKGTYEERQAKLEELYKNGTISYSEYYKLRNQMKPEK